MLGQPEEGEEKSDSKLMRHQLNVSHLCVSVPAHRPRISHLPVLDELGARAEPGPVGQVLVQKGRRHGGNHQRTRALWAPWETRRQQMLKC